MANANGGVTVQGNTQGIIVAHSGLYSIAERCQADKVDMFIVRCDKETFLSDLSPVD